MQFPWENIEYTWAFKITEEELKMLLQEELDENAWERVRNKLLVGNYAATVVEK